MRHTKQVWFSWSADVCEMEKKLGKEIVLSKLYNQWVANVKSPQTVVAEYSFQRTDVETGESILTFEYFDSNELLRFLQTRAHGASGLLQKFTVPKPAYNIVLQATWSPHAMLCTGRRSTHLLSHVWVSAADRCCTFDGAPSLSAVTPVSPFVKNKVCDIHLYSLYIIYFTLYKPHYKNRLLKSWLTSLIMFKNIKGHK